jgi:hypothetical protein
MICVTIWSCCVLKDSLDKVFFYGVTIGDNLAEGFRWIAMQQDEMRPKIVILSLDLLQIC